MVDGQLQKKESNLLTAVLMLNVSTNNTCRNINSCKETEKTSILQDNYKIIKIP